MSKDVVAKSDHPQTGTPEPDRRYPLPDRSCVEPRRMPSGTATLCHLSARRRWTKPAIDDLGRGHSNRIARRVRRVGDPHDAQGTDRRLTMSSWIVERLNVRPFDGGPSRSWTPASSSAMPAARGGGLCTGRPKKKNPSVPGSERRGQWQTSGEAAPCHPRHDGAYVRSEIGAMLQVVASCRCHSTADTGCMIDIINFDCPSCGAAYKLVRHPKPEPKPHNIPVFCVSCSGPLHADDSDHVLKYFMVARPGERRAQPR